MSGGIREGSVVETIHGQGTVLVLEWQNHPDQKGKPRDHAFVWVKLADGRKRYYPAADVHLVIPREVTP